MACGVLPPGLVPYPFAAIASIISFDVIGSFDSASTLAAASRALSLPSVFRGAAVFFVLPGLASAVVSTVASAACGAAFFTEAFFTEAFFVAFAWGFAVLGAFLVVVFVVDIVHLLLGVVRFRPSGRPSPAVR